MKRSAAILAILPLIICACEDRTRSVPTSPGSPPSGTPLPTPATGSIRGFVIEESGACIVGARVEIIRGVRQGEIQTQAIPCSVWDYAGGFDFGDVPINTEVTFRASATGYASKEFTATGVTPGPAVEVKLTKLP